ncbi:hypothetical protein [Aeromicrobium yanjiei]|uniref:Uncharacterized protein n=1 Tax=Aeromicrobium yanjiei TaxID=2662028 RepID=A0A5Q2MJG3_9ACTN|nr:hypothetical protein [Aeromicrobium yanjiei]QGG41853.1 hypothetical protein GEV26_11020 [Aeromicrobium yanjiei]
MPTLRTEYVQDEFVASAEYQRVHDISDKLLEHLNEPAARELLVAANMPGTSSAMVQNSFGRFSADLGFVDEAKGLFAEYPNKALRPDFFLRLGDTGILMEVERGKTTTNNMDLLDMWKCHLCVHAHYLFLMVPQALMHNASMSPKKEYNYVVKRLESFFVKGNHTNVRAVHIFGY